MDHVALQTLREEMREDCRIAVDASSKAAARFERHEEVAFEGCAHHLCRMYNAVEQMALRVAKVFENNIDDDQGWHSALLNRLAIEIYGMRPALIPHDLKPPLQELKAFRHVFVHAYELELDPEKLVSRHRRLAPSLDLYDNSVFVLDGYGVMVEEAQPPVAQG